MCQFSNNLELQISLQVSGPPDRTATGRTEIVKNTAAKLLKDTGRAKAEDQAKAPSRPKCKCVKVSDAFAFVCKRGERKTDEFEAVSQERVFGPRGHYMATMSCIHPAAHTPRTRALTKMKALSALSLPMRRLIRTFIQTLPARRLVPAIPIRQERPQSMATPQIYGDTNGRTHMHLRHNITLLPNPRRLPRAEAVQEGT